RKHFNDLPAVGGEPLDVIPRYVGPFFWLPYKSPADVRHLDLGTARGLRSSQLRVAVTARCPDRGKTLSELLIRGPAAQERAKVVSARGKEAGVQQPFSREASAAAVPAEG